MRIYWYSRDLIIFLSCNVIIFPRKLSLAVLPMSIIDMYNLFCHDDAQAFSGVGEQLSLRIIVVLLGGFVQALEYLFSFVQVRMDTETDVAICTVPDSLWQRLQVRCTIPVS